MTDDLYERGEPQDINEVFPSGRQEQVYRNIRNILARYMVRGTKEDLDHVALKIWRLTRR